MVLFPVRQCLCFDLIFVRCLFWCFDGCVSFLIFASASIIHVTLCFTSLPFLTYSCLSRPRIAALTFVSVPVICLVRVHISPDSFMSKTLFMPQRFDAQQISFLPPLRAFRLFMCNLFWINYGLTARDLSIIHHFMHQPTSHKPCQFQTPGTATMPTYSEFP